MVLTARVTFPGTSRFVSGIFWIYARMWRSWPYEPE